MSGWYGVYLCVTCHHPGGQHIIDKGCRLCDCDGYVPEAVQSRWNDDLTEAAMGGPTEKEGADDRA